MAYSQAQNKATRKYISANLEEIRFWVQKGEKANVKSAAIAAGESVTQYLIKAVNAYAGEQLLTPSKE